MRCLSPFAHPLRPGWPLLLLGLLALSACGDGSSYVLLTVASDHALRPDRLAVRLDNAGMVATVDVGDGQPFDIPPERTVALRIDPARSGSVDVGVRALLGDAQVAEAAGRVTLDPGHTVPLTVTLSSGDAPDLAVPSDLAGADLAGVDLAGADLAGDLAVRPDLMLHCNNRQRDGDESDVDCGGATCPGCAFRGACREDGDCLSDGCLVGRCGAPIFSFSGPATLSTGPLPATTQAVATGDLNNDGRPDIVTGRSPMPTVVTTWLNDGKGNFAMGGAIQVGGAGAVAVGQLDRGAPLDIAYLDENNGSVGVLLGTGDGKVFGNPTAYTTSGQAVAFLASGDLDGDGLMDVVTANSGSNSISLLRGSLGGALGMAEVTPSAGAPYAVALGDWNGDGLIDAVSGNAASKALIVYLNDKRGRLPASSILAPGTPTHAAIADLDGDKNPDVVAASLDDTLLFATGAGGGAVGRTAAIPLPPKSTPRFVLARDLNLDGKIDLVVSLYGSNQIAILPNRGGGTFDKPILIPSVAPMYLAAADFNNDGLLDVVAGNATVNTCSIYMNAAR